MQFVTSYIETVKASYFSELKTISKLAVACVFAQLAQVILIFIDNIMAGRHGTATIAAFGVATQIIIPVLILSMGFFFSINAIVANLLGKGDQKKIGKVVITSVYMAIIGSLLCIFLLHNVEPLLHAFNISPELYGGIQGYLQNVSFGILPYFLFLVFRFTSEGLLKAKYVMYCAISAIPVKILCNYIFVFGILGIEGKGVSGMGYATAATWTFMLLVLLAIIVKNWDIKALQLGKNWSSFDLTICREVLRIGAPIAFGMGIGVIFMSFTGMMIGGISSYAVAAHQSAYNFAFVISMLFQGVTVATTSRVAYLNGANRVSEVKKVVKIVFSLVLVIATLNGLVLIFLGEQIGQLYSSDKQLIAIIVILLFWGAFIQVPQALQETSAAVFRGFKITLPPTVIYSICFSLGIICGYILATRMQMNESGYWIGLLVSNGLTAIALNTLLFFKLRTLLTREE